MVTTNLAIVLFLLGFGLGFFLGFCVGDAHGWLDGLKEKRGVGKSTTPPYRKELAGES